MEEATVHLVRHGEVDNPRHVVYADMPGFHLSGRGRRQAEAAGRRLAAEQITAVFSSPLERAVETAGIIAAAVGTAGAVDPALTEWGLSRRWSGTAWEDLPSRFPGELEAYTEDPAGLTVGPETLPALATRMAEAVVRLAAAAAAGDVVVVSHQDPIQAARFALTGRGWEGFQRDKPGHASVVTLRRRGDSWEEVEYWEPDQGARRFPPLPSRP